jgi:UDP-N-acetylglucosamine 1-carboxyvinyltransferase
MALRAPQPDHLLEVTGGRPLVGAVRIAGSKNASLPLIAAALLTEETVALRNVPEIADTTLMVQIVEALGARVRELSPGALAIDALQVSGEVPAELCGRMRASIVLLGPLLARVGHARLPRPGGDAIGARRVEQHLRGLRAMGAEIEESSRECAARVRGRLRGARVLLDLPTVTGTENLIMAGCLAHGQTEIINAAREPHVQDLCRLLLAMGARIDGVGTDQLTIEGVDRLRGADHEVVPDYLEAGTYALAATAAGGEVRLEASPPEDLTQLLLKLQQAGAEVETGRREIVVRRDPDRKLWAVDMGTWVHPGFPTDLQAQYMALMTQAHGETTISEYLYENRFLHVPELMRMGARVKVSGRDAFIRGPARLHGTDVLIPDIRSGAALVIAALCARGTTELSGTWHLDRGYEDMIGKLTSLGATVARRLPEAAQAPRTLAAFE